MFVIVSKVLSASALLRFREPDSLAISCFSYVDKENNSVLVSLRIHAGIYRPALALRRVYETKTLDLSVAMHAENETR